MATRSGNPTFLTSAALLMLAPLSAASGILDDVGVLSATLGAGGMSSRACGIAYDGQSYWAGKVGSSSGVTLVRYDLSGVLLNSYTNGVDHRSLFTDAAGTVHATDYGGSGIAVFRYDGLGGSTLLYSLSSNPDSQMELGLGVSTGMLYGHSQGTIYVYDFATGVLVNTFQLSGYSSPSSYPGNAQLAVVAGASGETLLTYDSAGIVDAWDLSGTWLGSCAIGLASFDQSFSFSFADGLLWIELSAGGTWEGYDIGLAQGSLSGDVTSISLTSGGQQVLTTNLGSGAAFKSYQILGSASGSTPGFAYTGTAIPLNPDAYTVFSLLNPNVPPLLNSAGTLDINGTATTVFVLPPGSDPSLVGVQVHHAGVLLELAGGFVVVSEATVAVSVDLVP